MTLKLSNEEINLQNRQDHRDIYMKTPKVSKSHIKISHDEVTAKFLGSWAAERGITAELRLPVPDAEPPRTSQIVRTPTGNLWRCCWLGYAI